MESNRSRAATVPLIAGRAVLDLVNTTSWRGNPSRSEDHLQTATDCVTWASRVGVLSPSEAENLSKHIQRDRTAARDLIAELHRLRTAVTGALVPPTTASVEQLEPLIRAVLAHSHLMPDANAADRCCWQSTGLDAHTPARRLTLDLLDLLTSRHGRVGVCADNDCQWVYLDTSHAQNRQWCSSTDCGNRHRVRQHQHRRLPRTAPTEDRSG